jgi:endonuclease/exonuclease/phosphatase family metal-dependent hydrolase
VLTAAILSAGDEATGRALLWFAELESLASTERHNQDALARSDDLLAKPFIHHARVSSKAEQFSMSRTRPIRVAQWNIERGREWQAIRLALTDWKQFRQSVERGNRTPETQWQQAADEMSLLKDADFVILNEADFGMKRTGYANVAGELAGALGMNYAFGVEFVEVDPLYFGNSRIQLDDPAETDELAEDLRVDPRSYRGLHGNAVLSRFPIRSARIVRLPDCYDWFEGEVEGTAGLEKGRRWTAKRVFGERIQRQVRRGGRMALIVEVDDPRSRDGVLTVVSTHLEDRSKPACRKKQVETLLGSLRGIRGPLVIGADLNTTGADGRPTSLRREITKRVTSRTFWGGTAIRWFTPVGFVSMFEPVNYWKNLSPVIAPNRERALFKKVREFQFDDGGKFDFRGQKQRSGNRREGTLANSNQRSWKGFRPTFRFERNYFKMVGYYRLDWLFVKPAKSGGRAALEPHSPRTLVGLNRVVEERLSDHDPIVVELQD